MSDKVPLLIVTGFLGSGKSTLLSRWLVDPEFSGAAIVMNELGRLYGFRGSVWRSGKNKDLQRVDSKAR